MNNDEKKILSDRYDTPGLDMVILKNSLKRSTSILIHIKRREYLLNNLDEVYDILDQGRQKATVVASEYINNAQGNGYNY